MKKSAKKKKKSAPFVFMLCPFCKMFWATKMTEGSVVDPHGQRRMTCGGCVLTGRLQPTGVSLKAARDAAGYLEMKISIEDRGANRLKFE